MSAMPLWYAQLQWKNPPVPVTHFVTSVVGKEVIAAGAGVYIFTNDDQELTPRNVLYIGKADGARQTLRSRLGVYIRRFARRAGKPSKHAGLESIFHEYTKSPSAIYVRWAGCVAAREIEGSLIDLFDPPCNHKDEHRHGFAEDELIPVEYLYEVY